MKEEEEEFEYPPTEVTCNFSWDAMRPSNNFTGRIILNNDQNPDLKLGIDIIDTIHLCCNYGTLILDEYVAINPVYYDVIFEYFDLYEFSYIIQKEECVAQHKQLNEYYDNCIVFFNIYESIDSQSCMSATINSTSRLKYTRAQLLYTISNKLDMYRLTKQNMCNYHILVKRTDINNMIDKYGLRWFNMQFTNLRHGL